MQDGLTIGIYQHRRIQHTELLLTSIYRCTPGSYHIALQNSDGQKVSETVRRLRDMIHTRYFIMVSDDVEIMTVGWSAVLIRLLQEYPKVGVVGCLEWSSTGCVTAEIVNACMANAKARYSEPAMLCKWIPGYLMAFDLDRTPWVTGDPLLPGVRNMTDLDIGCSLFARGLSGMLSTTVLVRHGWKGRDKLSESPESVAAQLIYLREKWQGASDVLRLQSPNVTIRL